MQVQSFEQSKRCWLRCNRLRRLRMRYWRGFGDTDERHARCDMTPLIDDKKQRQLPETVLVSGSYEILLAQSRDFGPLSSKPARTFLPCVGPMLCLKKWSSRSIWAA